MAAVAVEQIVFTEHGEIGPKSKRWGFDMLQAVARGDRSSAMTTI